MLLTRAVLKFRWTSGVLLPKDQFKRSFNRCFIQLVLLISSTAILDKRLFNEALHLRDVAAPSASIFTWSSFWVHRLQPLEWPSRDYVTPVHS